ncbi:MAG: glycerate kinase [Lachnospiraceae bacterium]|nr:glycerate kinase [Lachnospiraceae bacterium]
MKLLFASDSFKGGLTSRQTIELLTKAAHEVFGDCETGGVPVADGGEGTVDAVIGAENGDIIRCEVHGPLMEKIEARYGVFGGDQAVIEMSASSGLPLVPLKDRNPMYTSTVGTGELIKDALDKGYRKLAVAIGGSATNDGGMGCARALGVRFLDKDGRELEGCGRDLINVRSIDLSGLDGRVKESEITVMCDVTNPLCGPDGATWTFGAQKGATPEIQEQLEEGMCNYRDVIKASFGVDCDALQGAGAAGGLGAALSVFFGGRMKSGIDTVLDLIHFDERLEGVDLVVTGEGRTDWQSCFGKVMRGVGERAKAKGIPVLGLSGSLGKGAMDICKYGVSSLMVTVNTQMTLEEAIEKGEDLYYEAAVRMFLFVRTGMGMKHIL